MNNVIRFSPRASLAMTGMGVQQMSIWETIGQRVMMKQEVSQLTTI